MKTGLANSPPYTALLQLEQTAEHTSFLGERAQSNRPGLFSSCWDGEQPPYRHVLLLPSIVAKNNQYELCGSGRSHHCSMWGQVQIRSNIIPCAEFCWFPRANSMWELGRYLSCPSETCSVDRDECAHQYNTPTGPPATGKWEVMHRKGKQRDTELGFPMYMQVRS